MIVSWLDILYEFCMLFRMSWYPLQQYHQSIHYASFFFFFILDHFFYCLFYLIPFNFAPFSSHKRRCVIEWHIHDLRKKKKTLLRCRKVCVKILDLYCRAFLKNIEGYTSPHHDDRWTRPPMWCYKGKELGAAVSTWFEDRRKIEKGQRDQTRQSWSCLTMNKKQEQHKDVSSEHNENRS